MYVSLVHEALFFGVCAYDALASYSLICIQIICLNNLNGMLDTVSIRNCLNVINVPFNFIS